ncbi:uncharacterized protein LOC133821379 [Humulus lupulus]|uniref:uncharacterized protein LOC133821379 n=1 Tax=Humulus lupulus TaxID=3486 RepID=UPI002B40546D|nr:uncharacterized protein LOC133821379 [Humulus lupulus]
MVERRSSIRSLETQVGQLAKLMEDCNQGALPSSIVVNPKEQCQAVTLRSETKYDGPTMDDKGKKIEDQHATSPTQEEVIEDLPKKENLKYTEPTPKIPYPQQFRKVNLNKKFSKFLELFKNLHINIPFNEALEKMPNYLKFLKKNLSKKRKLKEYETVAVTEECSGILQQKLPSMLKDPGSFNIPCSIGGLLETKALCDLGASINLMLLSIFRELNLGEARPTTVSLQMADYLIKHPRGIIEDVLVKVDNFIFFANFIVLDMEEDTNFPIILGRPFLATGRALIDVQKGELKLQVQNEVVTCSVFAATKIPTCCRVEVVKREENKLKVSKQRSMVKSGMRKSASSFKNVR